ncbi:MAG: DNA-processing protein DprA [Chitinophagaceae bacterium]
MEPDVLYQIALTHIPQIGTVCGRILVDLFGDAHSVFKASTTQLCKLDGVGEVRAHAIHRFKSWIEAEEELRFIEANRITPLFIRSKDYPQRLLNCTDAPLLLYQKGETSLNTSRVIAVVGTRHQTDYGKQLTEKLIADLASLQVMVISGLAYGIDALAHKAAIQHGLPTVGVLAHGLDALYPPRHRSLAASMLENGGSLLTEFGSGTQPDRHNFPIRNRIVAGLSDAVVVVETGPTGGSLITAELANGYNRDVFAFPGRSTDFRSQGCNELIRNNKAALITQATDLITAMNWDHVPSEQVVRQSELFVELTEDEKKLIQLLRDKGQLSLDELNWYSQLSNSQVAAGLLSLELKNQIRALPGSVFRIA